MYCSNCNKTLPNDATFCDTCGARLEADKIPELQEPSIQENSSQQSSPGNQTNNSQQSNPGNQTYNNYQNNQGQQSYGPGFNYPPPVYNNIYNGPPSNGEHMTTWGWIGRFAINLIPIVGPIIYLVLLFVWAFGQCRYPSLKTFSRAMLLMMLFGIIISIIFGAFIGAMFRDLMNGNDFFRNYQYY